MIHIRPPGLLGNNDGNPNNDLQNRDGTKVLPLKASEEMLYPVASTCECLIRERRGEVWMV